MKKVQITVFAISLAAAMSASASTTYSGAALSGLIYSGNPGDAQPAVVGGTDVAQLFTADLSTTGDSPAVFIQISTPMTLASLVGSYSLLSTGTTVNPYWILYLTDDPSFDFPVVATDGSSTLNGSSLVHVGGLISGSITLSALDADIDPISGLPYGQDTVAYAGLEIGDGGSGPGTANIDSITLGTAVPEPTTVIAGALLLLPFGVSAVRRLRKKQTA